MEFADTRGWSERGVGNGFDVGTTTSVGIEFEVPGAGVALGDTERPSVEGGFASMEPAGSAAEMLIEVNAAEAIQRIESTRSGRAILAFGICSTRRFVYKCISHLVTKYRVNSGQLSCSIFKIPAAPSGRVRVADVAGCGRHTGSSNA